MKNSRIIKLKNLEIAQRWTDCYKSIMLRKIWQIRLLLSFLLFSTLQLDELELELEDELEELELDDHLEGPLLLLGWRGEVLAFALEMNNEGDGLREGVCPCLYSPVGWTAPLGSNCLETVVKMHCRGWLEAVTWSWSHLEVGLGWPAWHVGPADPTCQPPGFRILSRVFSCPLEPFHQFS
jgi:hypothetical protein